MKQRIAEIRERRLLNLGEEGVSSQYEDPSFYVLLTPEERDWVCTLLEEAEEVVESLVAVECDCLGCNAARRWKEKDDAK